MQSASEPDRPVISNKVQLNVYIDQYGNQIPIDCNPQGLSESETIGRTPVIQDQLRREIKRLNTEKEHLT
jgi:hypothetical protein